MTRVGGDVHGLDDVRLHGLGDLSGEEDVVHVGLLVQDGPEGVGNAFGGVGLHEAFVVGVGLPNCKNKIVNTELRKHRGVSGAYW